MDSLITKTLQYLETNYDYPRRRILLYRNLLLLGAISPGQLCDDLDIYKPDFILESEDETSENAQAFSKLQSERES